MSNSNNQLTSLINQLSRRNSGELNITEFIQQLVPGSSSSASAKISLSAPSLGLKNLAEGSGEKLQSIQFGKPSSNNTSTGSNSNLLSGLLSQAASGGLANALTGGLSSFAGLGGLISGIASLFGGSSKAAPAPLALFSLPNSIQETAYVGSQDATTHAGESVDQGAKPATTSAVYTTGGLVNNTGRSAPPALTDGSSIAQAVKNALLTSSSLSDVIAEI